MSAPTKQTPSENIMENLSIGTKITFHTSSGKKVDGVVTGRNWSYEHLVSYVVRYDGMDMPVCAKSFKAQLLC